MSGLVPVRSDPEVWEGSPWEMQPSETSVAFHAFSHYRDLEAPERAVGRSLQRHQDTCPTGKSRGKPVAPGAVAGWEAWCTKHRWVERVRAWDMERDKVRREEHLIEVRAMGQRHAQMAESALDVAMAPALAAARALREDPGLMQRLVDLARDDEGVAGVLGLIDFANNVAKNLPALADMERKARGDSAPQSERDRPSGDLRIVVEYVDDWR